MPTPAEIQAAVAAIHARRERSRTALTAWPEIEEEARLALEAAEKVRNGPTIKAAKLNDVQE